MSLAINALALAAGTAAAISASSAFGQNAKFDPIPLVRELSGQLLVRPVQPENWAARGVANAAAHANQARAILLPQTLRVLPADIHVVKLPQGRAEAEFCQELMATGLFEFAEPDWIVYPVSQTDTRPDDPVVRAQWQLDRIRAPRAWNGFTGNAGIVCAFVDTGVDLNHPDLAPLLVPGFNSANNIPQAAGGLVGDVNGHGTAVAGSALAMGNNNSGGSGVCWSARVMPIRATNYASGSAFLSNILYGASWAAFNGAKVVSVSYAGVESSSVEPTGTAIKNNYGGLLIWAAGNSSSHLNFDYPNTTVVGSTDINDSLAWDTNYGPAIDVMAPGVEVLVPALGGGYAPRSGSSFAAPIAAGVLALAWSDNPQLTPDEAMNVLYRSSFALEPIHALNSTGWGRVDALAALQLARGASPPKAPQILRAAAVPPSLIPGLQVTYYAIPGATALPHTFGSFAIGSTAVHNLNFTSPGGSTQFPGLSLASGFGASFRGYIEVPSTGVYTLTLDSRDGSRLHIDNRLIVENDGIHTQRFRSGSVWLERGLHHFHCDYFSSTAQPSLVLSIRGQQLGETVVPPSMFFSEAREHETLP